MSANYDLGTDVGKVRLIIGDTDVFPESDAVFTDEELEYFLTVNSDNINLAAADACEAWVAKYAASPDSEKMGDYAYTQKAVANYNKLAKELREKESSSPVFEWAEPDLTGENEEED